MIEESRIPLHHPHLYPFGFRPALMTYTQVFPDTRFSSKYHFHGIRFKTQNGLPNLLDRSTIRISTEKQIEVGFGTVFSETAFLAQHIYKKRAIYKHRVLK